MNPKQKAKILKQKIRREVKANIGKGINAARFFLVARVKETVSVPAPRRRMPDGSYRATEPATPGAPVRKLSGRLRMGLSSVLVNENKFAVGSNARSPAGFRYPAYHEVKTPGKPGSGQHKYIAPTVKKYRNELAKILKKNIKDLGNGRIAGSQ